MSDGALSDIRVVELGNVVSAPFCAKQLASLGAEVIKVETPGIGDESRTHGPFLDDHPNPEGSGLFLYLNSDKMSVTLNLEEQKGRAIFLELLKTADILVENNLPREMLRLGLDYDSLKRINPQLIVTSITPFGWTGPYRDFKGSDLIGYHSGGLGSITPRPGAGLPDDGPLRMRGHLADFLAGLNAAGGTMCALFERDQSNVGQHLDVSTQEAVATSIATNFAFYTYEGRTLSRQGSSPSQPVATMACKDGYVDIQCMTEEQWQRLVGVMGDPDWANMEAFKDVFARGENWDGLEPLMTDWLMGKGKQEFYREAQAASVPSAPVNTTADLIESEHLAERKFFVELDHPETGVLKYPGPFIRFSETPALMKQRAPFLGEHNQSIFGDRLNYSPKALAALSSEGVI